MPVQPPSNYVEKHPRRGPWIVPRDQAPLLDETVEVLLPDGTTQHATWMATGFHGWIGENRHGEVRCLGWRRIETRGMWA